MLRLRIDALAMGGAGVARDGGAVVFVEGTAPGDVVEARVERRGPAGFGRVLRLLAPGAARVAPPCPYQDACGGCPWMHVAPAAQTQAKEAILYDALARLGGLAVDVAARRPVAATPADLGYRRRARLHVRGREVGFLGRRSHRLVDVERCAVLAPPLASALTALRRSLADGGPLAGLAEVGLVAGLDAAAASFHLDRAPKKAALRRLDSLARDLGVSALALAGEREVARFGDPAVMVGRVGTVPLYSRPDLFTQAHAQQNERLQREVADAVAGAQAVLELYAGGGNFTFAVAAAAREVTAVEGMAAAVELARRSAREGGVGQVRFVVGDALAVARALGREGRRFDAVLLDPPRTGARGIAKAAVALGAARVVYVSCDPATLARDARELATDGFRIARVQPFDLFPQTSHVEAVVTFER